MTKRRCALIGGGGFIGQHLASGLVKAGYPVVVCVRDKNSFNSTSLNKNNIVEIDLQSPSSYKSVIQTGDIVFDLAAPSVPYSSMLHPNDEVKNHILPHMQLIEFACKKKVHKYIFFSSGGGVYGEKPLIPVPEDAPLEPISPYTISKITIEFFLKYCCRMAKVSALIYRLSNPYGPGQKKKPGFGVIPTLYEHTKRGTVPTLYNSGNLIRDFIYIDDTIEAILLSFWKKNKHTVYNLGSGKGTSIKDVWRTIRKLTKTTTKANYEPKRPIDVDAIVLDTNRFQSEFNWKPRTSIEEGLEKFCESR